MQKWIHRLKTKNGLSAVALLIGVVVSVPSFAETTPALGTQSVESKIPSPAVVSTDSQGVGVIKSEKIQPTKPQPFTQAEIRQGLKEMQQKMISSIEVWGSSLKSEDFERTWTGRQLVKSKRQEVCGIYQTVINDTYRLAKENRARLSQKDQTVLNDRNLFIQSLGFKENIVDTKMGFNCRLR